MSEHPTSHHEAEASSSKATRVERSATFHLIPETGDKVVLPGVTLRQAKARMLQLSNELEEPVDLYERIATTKAKQVFALSAE